MSFKGGKYCCARKCSSCGWKDQSISFFRIPRDYDRRKIWLRRASREDLLAGDAANKCPGNHRLCSLHFEDSAFSNSQRKRLIWNSIPSIFNHNDDTVDSSRKIVESVHSYDSAAILQPRSTDNDEINCDQLCRLCAKVSNYTVELFSEPGLQRKLVEKIHSHLPIEVKVDDTLPLQACVDCVTKLDICHELVRCSLQSQKRLQDLLNLVISTNGDNDTSPNGEVSNANSTFVSDSLAMSETEIQHESCVNSTKLDAPGHLHGDSASPPSFTDLVEPVEQVETDIISNKIQNRFCNSSLSCHVIADTNDDQPTNKYILSMHGHGLDDTTCSESNSVDMHLDIFCVDEDSEQSTNTVEHKIQEGFSSSGEVTQLNAQDCWLCTEKFTDGVDLVDHQLRIHYDSVFSCSECDVIIYGKESYHNHKMFHYVISSSDNHAMIITQNAAEDKESDATTQLTDAVDDLGKDRAPLPVLDNLELEHCVSSEENSMTDVLDRSCSHELYLEVDHTEVCMENVVEVISEDIGETMGLVRNNSNSNSCDTDLQEYNKEDIPVILENAEGYPCRVCSCWFSTNSELRIHISSHKLSVHQCQYCDKVMATKYKLIDHERVHTNEKPFFCNQCNKQFRVKQALKIHLRNHNEELKPFICRVSASDVECGRRFGTKIGLSEHMAVHATTPSFSCDLCDKVFRHKTSLFYHKRSHAHLPKSIPLHMCQYCGKSFNDGHSLTMHIRAHTSEKPHVCETCSKQFRQASQLALHCKVHSSEQKYSCDVCCKRFKRRNNMICHLKRHSRSHRYSCTVCNFPTDDFRDLVMHRKTHSQEELNRKKKPLLKTDPGRFKCDECGKFLSTKVTLQRHMTLHTGVRPYECDLCEKSFTKKGDLTNHRVIHSGMKPFPCQFCEEGFMNKQACDVHERSHTGLTPFKCKVCTKEFRSKMTLNSHSAVHSDLRPYLCGYCGKGFRRRDTLNAHVRIHTGERPYRCSTCERSFTQQGDCRIHERRAHGVKSGLPEKCSAFSCLLCGIVVTNDVELSAHYEVDHFEQLAESDALEMMVIGVENSNSLPELTVCNREDLGLGSF